MNLEGVNEAQSIKYKVGDEEKYLVVAPVELVFKGNKGDNQQYSTEQKQFAIVGIEPVINGKCFEFDLKFWNEDDWKKYFWRYLLAGTTVVIAYVATALCIFTTSHSVIKPLRQLNSRMREILEA